MIALARLLKSRGARVRVDRSGRVVSVRIDGGRVIAAADLDLLVQCRHLEHLDLEGSRVDDPGLARLATIESLETLWLHDARISDAGLKPLGQLKSLRNLGLAGTRIGDR